MITTNGDVKYPKIKVKLAGEDGNTFAIISRVRLEMRRHGVPKEEQDNFMKEAMSGDYTNVIKTVMRWVVVK